MKQIFSFALAITLLSSCGNDSGRKKYKYTYIEVSREEGIFSADNKEKKEVIEAISDSAAYIMAFENFAISKMVNLKVNDMTGTSYSTPLHFRLLNDAGVDITNTVNFANKSDIESRIIKEVFEDKGSSLAIEGNDIVEVAKVDSGEIKKLLQYFNIRKDEFDPDGIVWFTPKNSPKYVNQNGIYCYFQTQNGIATNFRFKVQYYSDEWLFFQKCQFSIDGEAYEFVPSDTERDSGNGGYIWEWFDQRIYSSDLPLITALANAKSAKMKLIGRQYYDIKNITSSQVLSIKRTMDLYKAMGGSF